MINWRQGKLLGPRDPTFTRPDMDEEEEEHEYEVMGGGPRQTTDSSAYDSRPDSTANPFRDEEDNRYSGYSSAPSSQPPRQSTYTPTPPAAGRPSIDAYGAFSDPAPSGFASTASPTRPSVPPVIPEPDFEPRVSRTMQYTDPYAAVRASITQPPSGYSSPPSYEGYQGYR